MESSGWDGFGPRSTLVAVLLPVNKDDLYGGVVIAMTSLIEQLESVCAGQPYYGILITGWFLSEEQITSTRDMLSPDSPSIGALGRLLNVPVYPLGTAQSVGADELRTEGDVTYSCIPWSV